VAISPIGGGLPSLPSIPTPSSGNGVGGASDVPGFGDSIKSAMDNLNNLHATADSLAQQAATGSLQDIHDYTIAATEASLATELTVAVRNKAVEAFQEIMRMGV
jgi:flagellar hook-basal body complex protein FliE